MYERAQVDTMATRMHERENPLMQVVVGSRQTGKSTMIAQALRKADVRNHFVSMTPSFPLSSGCGRNGNRRATRPCVTPAPWC
mgnify:CR=1 FL=1